ncbi:MAG: hypothetical protein AABZ22_01385 [Nitrospirota bacterium]
MPRREAPLGDREGHPEVVDLVPESQVFRLDLEQLVHDLPGFLVRILPPPL